MFDQKLFNNFYIPPMFMMLLDERLKMEEVHIMNQTNTVVNEYMFIWGSDVASVQAGKK